MEYLVLGTDGKEYGPVDVEGLREWVGQNRLAPHSTVKDFLSGRTMTAGEIPGLFGPVPTGAPSPGPAAPYGGFTPSSPSAHPAARSEDMSLFWWAILESAAAVLIFLFLHGLGLIFAGYALYNAIRCQASGNRYGIVAIIVASIALIIVGVGWLMRMGGSPV